MPSKAYKDYKIYMCFALNRLVGELDIDLYQDGLEEKIDDILNKSDSFLTKEDIKHEIRSNHYMTNKVIDKLAEDGLIEINKVEKLYRITLTNKGVLHIRNYNTFYKQIYADQIKEHYRFRGLPHWFIKA
jgi:predicted transcriptional regulator